MEAKRLLTLRDIFYIFFKNKTLILTVFISAIVIALIYCIVTPSQYRAETKILVKIGKAQFSGLEQMPERQNMLIQERSQNIRNEIELIKGQYLTEKVIERLKGKIEPMKGDQSLLVKIIGNIKEGLTRILSSVGIYKRTSKDKRMILTFMDALRVNFLEDTDMISLTFDWTDPRFAALVANLYADEYILQHTLVNESQKSHKFYNEQIDVTDKKLKETEDNLQIFLKDTNIANISLQKELLLKNLADLENRYNLAVLDISQAAAKVKKIKDMAAQPNVWIETPEMGSNLVNRQEYLRTIDESYFRLKTERQRLLKIYTSEASEIKSIDAQLENLRKQKGDSLLNIASMEFSLAENRRSSLAKEIDNERRILNDINSKTYTLKQLERDRDLTEHSYQTYKKKGEELRISDDLDAKRISSVKIATPAIPPLSPAYPKRGFIILASALIGLFLSFGFSAIREFFNHTFKDDADIGSVLGVPFLMAVPMRVSVGNPAESSNAPKMIVNGFGKIFHRNGKKPASSATHLTAGTSNSFVFVIFVVIGISGYFVHLYQSMLFYQNSVTMQRFITQSSNQSQQVMLASMNPADASSSNQQNQTKQENEMMTDKAANMDLLSDKMEQRRAELEKRRVLLEKELENIKSEIEVSKPTKEQQKAQETIPPSPQLKPQQAQPVNPNNYVLNNVSVNKIQNSAAENIVIKQNAVQENQEYIVGAGETIVSILRNNYNVPTHLIYNESINLIRAVNPDLKNLQALNKGQKIRIPKEVVDFGKKQ